jgi:hypothetical protein
MSEPWVPDQDELNSIREQMQSAVAQDYKIREPIEVEIREYAPEGGWQPEQFPQLTVVSIPYTSNPNLTPDPRVYCLPDGWMFVEIGTVRLAVPNRDEWNKLVYMVTCMYNTAEKTRADAARAKEDSEPWEPDPAELDEFSSLLSSALDKGNGRESRDDDQADHPG